MQYYCTPTLVECWRARIWVLLLLLGERYIDSSSPCGNTAHFRRTKKAKTLIRQSYGALIAKLMSTKDITPRNVTGKFTTL